MYFRNQKQSVDFSEWQFMPGSMGEIMVSNKDDSLIASSTPEGFVVSSRDIAEKTSSSGMRHEDETRVREFLGHTPPEVIFALMSQASRLSPQQASGNRENLYAKIGFDPGLNRMMLGWIPDRIKQFIETAEPLEKVAGLADSFKRSGKKSFIFTGIGGSGLGVGTIVDTFGQPKDAVIYTLTTPSRDQQSLVLDNLKQRYDGDLKKALETAKQLEQIQPAFPGLPAWLDQLENQLRISGQRSK